MAAATTQFGNYLLEERLAVGGMAEVFRARRLGAAGFSRPVCIKRILKQFCEERAYVEMFIDEANTGAQLRHGNIVSIDDFGVVDGQFYLAMELIHGVDVSRLVAALDQDNRALPWEVGTFILHEVLVALDYAHRKKAPDGGPLNVVHRDVSPHNVLVSYAGELKLTDFGIARARTRIHQTTQHVVKGKLSYMAPEQAKAQELDGRADLFSLGVSAFEWFANQRPFTGKNEPEVISNLLLGKRVTLQSLRPDVPAGVVRVIDGLLQGDREQRIATAGDAIAMLEPWVTHTGGRWLSSIVAHYFAGSAVTAARPMIGFSASSLPEAPFREGRVKKPSVVSNDPTQAAILKPSAPAPAASANAMLAPESVSSQPPPPRLSQRKISVSEPVQSYVATQISQPAPELAQGPEIGFEPTITPVATPVSMMHDGRTHASAVIEAVIASDPGLPPPGVDSLASREVTLASVADPSSPRHLPTQTTMEPVVDIPAVPAMPAIQGEIGIATSVTQSIALLAMSEAENEARVDRSAKTQTSVLSLRGDKPELPEKLREQNDAQTSVVREDVAIADKTKMIQVENDMIRRRQLRWLWTAAVISMILSLSAAVWVAVRW